MKSGNDSILVDDFSTMQEKELGFPHNPPVTYMTGEQVLNAPQES